MDARLTTLACLWLVLLAGPVARAADEATQALLEPARKALSEADRARAGRYAPRTFEKATELFAAAEAAPTPAAVDAARLEAVSALRLARIARDIDREEPPLEEWLLRLDATLTRLADLAGLDARDWLFEPAAGAALVDRIAVLRDELRNAERELADRDRQIASLEDEVRELDLELTGTSAERDQLIMRDAAESRLREQLEQLETLLADGEGEMLRQGNQVVLRVTGLGFASGSARLPAAGLTLLDRISSALVGFPAAELRVEGHTDSSGSETANRRLAEERAAVVAGQLAVKLGRAPGSIVPSGFGSARPLAGNDTASGRARNRRIEILLTLPADTPAS
jgi:outer membrane protein OmpA-like peptidoglycan-associated protein